jgi:hypothetical protein
MKKLSEEHKRKLSEAKKGKLNPNFGKNGSLSNRFGKKHTEETKKILSEITKKQHKEQPINWKLGIEKIQVINKERKKQNFLKKLRLRF